MELKNSIYDYCVYDDEGKKIPLSKYKGKVLLIVNTATGCGFTPQYAQLEELYEEYHDKGLVIIDIPCNQFEGQTPGTAAEIKEFCQLNYNTQFPQMQKSKVNGPDELPLYAYLKSKIGFAGFGTGEEADEMNELLREIDPDYKNNAKIKWNFTKFVVNREGQVVARFEPTADFKKIEDLIKKLIAQPDELV